MTRPLHTPSPADSCNRGARKTHSSSDISPRNAAAPRKKGGVADAAAVRACALRTTRGGRRERKRMYGLYQQLKAMVWGEGSEREKTEPPSAPSPPPQPQKRFFSGEITSLSDTSGMIDHQVSSTHATAFFEHHTTSRDTLTGVLYSECGYGRPDSTGLCHSVCE